jgi:hypothetical protein
MDNITDTELRALAGLIQRADVVTLTRFNRQRRQNVIEELTQDEQAAVARACRAIAKPADASASGAH